MQIDDIKIKIVKDSRGEDTLEADMNDIGLEVKDAVPSGKSRGSHEAVVLEPKKEIEKFNEIKDKLLKENFETQKKFDNFLIGLDATENKSNLGGSLILALSLAFARLKAKEENLELFQYIRSISDKRLAISGFPKPIFNVINGGAHAKNNLEFQEFQVIPMVSDFGLAMSVGREYYRKLGEIIYDKFGNENVFLGDEAGYSAPFKNNEEALEIMAELIEIKKYPLRIGLDVAATQFYQRPTPPAGEHDQRQGTYKIGDREYSEEGLKEYYLKLIDAYNIISIEDPFHEESFAMFAGLTADLRRHNADRRGQESGLFDKLIITDDLTTTNPKRLDKAIKGKSGNAILVKLNQIGTLTETLEVVKMAYENNWQAVVSHRSGETMDDFIADLAVAVGAWGIKAGAPAKPERMAKYDRLLQIYNIY